MAIKSIYLSGVTGEFLSYKNELFLALTRRGFQVQFPGDLSLESLETSIRQCDAVICLAGDAYGPAPDLNEARTYARISEGPHSFAQWEFILAKHLGKPVYLFTPEANAECVRGVEESTVKKRLQESFCQTRLGETKSRPRQFKNPADLKEKALAIIGPRPETGADMIQTEVSDEMELQGFAGEFDDLEESKIEIDEPLAKKEAATAIPESGAAPGSPAPAQEETVAIRLPSPAPAATNPAREETAAISFPPPAPPAVDPAREETAAIRLPAPSSAPPPTPAPKRAKAADETRSATPPPSPSRPPSLPKKKPSGNFFSRFFKKRGKEVSLSSFVPSGIKKLEVFTVQCWIHWEIDKNEVKKRAKSSGHSKEAGSKTGMEIEEGALVELSLKPRILTDPDGEKSVLTKTVRWEGHPSNVEFLLLWPESAPAVVYEKIEIAVEGIPLGECTLRMRLDQNPKENLVSDFKKIARAFVSYAHEDSQRVLASVQAFQTATNVDLFLDVDSLRAGENWEEKLKVEVSSRDALLLYWSENAAKSEWVDREWRLAFQERGMDYIKPMPLDPVTAPAELAELQFADKWSRLAEYQRLKAGG